MLVIDASVAVRACFLDVDIRNLLSDSALCAPDLLLWEAWSTLRAYEWRLEAGRPTEDMGRMERDHVRDAMRRLTLIPIEIVASTPNLTAGALEIARGCGFGRLYDAAYVSLARERQSPLVTLDRRLRDSPARRIVSIVGPADLG